MNFLRKFFKSLLFRSSTEVLWIKEAGKENGILQCVFAGEFFEVGEEVGDEAEEGHVGAEVIDSLDAGGVGEVAEHCRRHAGDAECKAEKESRHHPELVGQQFLRVEKYSRECRRKHESDAETQHYRHRQVAIRHGEAERCRTEYRRPDHRLASVAVADRSSDKCTECRRHKKDKEAYLRGADAHTESVYQIEGVVVGETRHIYIFREYQH